MEVDWLSKVIAQGPNYRWKLFLDIDFMSFLHTKHFRVSFSGIIGMPLCSPWNNWTKIWMPLLKLVIEPPTSRKVYFGALFLVTHDEEMIDFRPFTPIRVYKHRTRLKNNNHSIVIIVVICKNDVFARLLLWIVVQNLEQPTNYRFFAGVGFIGEWRTKNFRPKKSLYLFIW